MTLFDGKTLRPDWPFGDLRPLSYGMIMADPAWEFETYSENGHGKSAQRHYDCMDLDAITKLPVYDLALPDCVLWLWTTAPMLERQLPIMGAWGFKFCTSGVWVKTTKAGKPIMGLGYVLRNEHEYFLIGTRGSPKFKAIRSVIFGRRREHSRKPEEAYAAAEKLVPDVTRLDLFSREKRPGWDNWGKEATKFNEAA